MLSGEDLRDIEGRNTESEADSYFSISVMEADIDALSAQMPVIAYVGKHRAQLL